MLWAIVLSRTVTDQAWYFCMFWMPGYFEEKLHLTLKQSGMIGWIPFFIAALEAVASGYFSDILVRRCLPPWRSRLFILIGAACFTPLAIAIPLISSNVIVIVLFSVFAAVCQIWLFNLTTLVADTFPKTEVASVLGISGSFGALGGLLSTKIIGTAIGSVGYNSIFVVMGSLHLIGALFLYGLINRSSLR
jgi:ACS family hexuronate transporter-like MFS transporter